MTDDKINIRPVSDLNEHNQTNNSDLNTESQNQTYTEFPNATSTQQQPEQNSNPSSINPQQTNPHVIRQQAETRGKKWSKEYFESPQGIARFSLILLLIIAWIASGYAVTNYKDGKSKNEKNLVIRNLYLTAVIMVFIGNLFEYIYYLFLFNIQASRTYTTSKGPIFEIMFFVLDIVMACIIFSVSIATSTAANSLKKSDSHLDDSNDDIDYDRDAFVAASIFGFIICLVFIILTLLRVKVYKDTKKQELSFTTTTTTRNSNLF